MIRPSAAVQGRLGLLSKQKTELLKLLLEENSRRTQEIRPYPRGTSGDEVRLPTSWPQQRLWFIDQLEGGRAGYQVPLVVRLRGTLDQEALKKALGTLIQRHEILRTVFVCEDEEPAQKIASDCGFPLNVIDLSDYENSELELQVRLLKTEEVQGKFDLSQGPLIRGRLLRLETDEHILLITLHHIIADNWSKGVLMRELAHLYGAYREGRGDPLAPLPIQYADYAVWQRRQWTQGEALEAQLSYWRARLEGSASALELPTDRQRPAVQSYRGENSWVVLDAQLTKTLRVFAQRNELTLFMVLCAGWAILMYRLTGQEDILIGTPVANRQRPELEGLIGLFVNTLVLRFRVQGDLSVKEFLEQVKEVTLGSYDHQDIPFDKVVEALQPDRRLSSNPLFQVMFALQNTPKSELQLPGLTATLEGSADAHAIFDLLLPLEERGEEIVGSLNYVTDLFDRSTIERWMACFTILLRGLTEDVNGRIGEVSILPKKELNKVLHLFNATQAIYPKEQLVHELFEARTQCAPNAVAVVWKDQSLTYAELNGKANQVARYLKQRGMQVGECVPIVMQRCMKILIAQLAVLKGGGVYVPVDPSLPIERRAFMMRDCGVRRVLTDRSSAVFEEGPIEWVDFSEVANVIDELPTNNLQLKMHNSSPAYVMYTSGSTGVPKGVVVPHHAVNRLAINNGYAQIEPTDCIAHCSNPTFDASTFEIWAALLNGARVVIVPQSVVLDAHCFCELLRQERVTVLWLTIGLFMQYTDSLAIAFAQLRYLITGGDVVDPASIRRTLGNNPPKYLLNAYGPTECTTFSTTHRVEAVGESSSNISIGKPIANARIHILDSYLQSVPIGVTGDIYIGGAGVALGYLNRPGLTAERFIADPFSTDPKSRLYRSGDLGRWRAGGTIDFLGRNDQQVKLRGFRIELGEIERQLAWHPQVKEAAVIVRDDVSGGKRLVAYITQRDGTGPTVGCLREHLQAVLPEYMVPSAFVTLESFPLTPNGKLDRRALPLPEAGAYATQEFIAPRGEMEETLAAIWQELLGVDQIGREDNFFGLGGHSLLVLKALSRINRSLDCALAVRDVYMSPTLRQLATRIREGIISEESVSLMREAVLDDGIVEKLGIPYMPPQTVMLTGATGFVGRFLLAELLQNTSSMIYCLVRASSQHQALSRLRGTLEKWHLWRDEFEPRIVAIPGDLRLPRLGIDELTYEVLCQSVDSIFHCGTSMNHLETYAMAKPANVEAARELLKLAASRKTKLINYISTLSVFRPSAMGTARVVDEISTIDDEKHLFENGYSASKWVAEKIFMRADERGIPCNIFRLGLVWADTEKGRYDELQREYRVFKSCLLSGCGIKNYRFDMAPTPVDYVAHAVVFLGTRHHGGHGVFHISSSHQSIDGVFELCNESVSTSLDIMSLYDWISEVKRLHQRGYSLPIVPLIEYAFSMDEESFCEHQRRMARGSLRVECSRTQRELESAGILTPVVTDKNLIRYVESMFIWDSGLQESLGSNGGRISIKQRSA